MSNELQDQYWIVWNDPSDNLDKYFALSSETGHYWTTDVDDPNIVDGLSLDIVHTTEDTIKQIAEKWRMQKGKAYERKNLFQHPNEKAWLCVEKKPCGPKNPGTGKIPREYKAFWSRKFKSVVCISNITGQRQGNPSMNDKDYAKKNSAKAREERKRRLETMEKASKRLNFNPAEQLIAWAQGDETKLNTKEPIKNSQRIKALELLASYVWSKPKPYDPSLTDKSKEHQGPTIHVTLPSNSRELDQHVLKHDTQESLDTYFKNTYHEPDEIQQIDSEAGEYDEKQGVFLPSNNREE